MGDYGIKIARTGADITSTDLRDFVLHSKYKSFKSQARATSTITLPAGSTSVSKTIAHGLGYTPFFFIAAEMNTDKWYNLEGVQTVPIDSSPGNSYQVSVYADATNLNINIGSGAVTFGSDQTYNLTYFVIIDEVV